MDDARDALTSSTYFSTIDLSAGYWQIPFALKSRPNAAFVTYEGLYEWLRMPMGLTDAPATFQRMMDFVLHKLKWKIFMVYLDDIIISSKTFRDHLRDINHIKGTSIAHVDSLSRQAVGTDEELDLLMINEDLISTRYVVQVSADSDPERLRYWKQFSQFQREDPKLKESLTAFFVMRIWQIIIRFRRESCL
jgi:hypothetical protein